MRFLFLQNIQTSSGDHSAPHPRGTRVLSWGVEQLVHAVDHSPPFSGEVKNKKSYTSALFCPLWHGQGQLYLFLLIYIQKLHFFIHLLL